MSRLPLFFCAFALACSCAFAEDTLYVDVHGVKSPVGLWWGNSKGDAPVAVWFHGGMTSGNCEKGLVAGQDFAKLFDKFTVVSASACRDRHWLTEEMIRAVDCALDSVAARRKKPVGEVNLVGVSDGSLAVIVYSLSGRRKVKSRLLVSSYGKLLGEAAVLGLKPVLRDGRWLFLQGGADRLFPAREAVPWIDGFCRAVGSTCRFEFDPAGEHDWQFWREKHLPWIKQGISP